MRLLGQQHLVLGSEEPVNETLELLGTHARQVVQGLSGSRHFEPRQAEGVASALMLRQPIPQPLHEHADHLLAEANSGISPPQA